MPTRVYDAYTRLQIWGNGYMGGRASEWHSFQSMCGGTRGMRRLHGQSRTIISKYIHRHKQYCTLYVHVGLKHFLEVINDRIYTILVVYNCLPFSLSSSWQPKRRKLSRRPSSRPLTLGCCTRSPFSRASPSAHSQRRATLSSTPRSGGNRG